MNGKIMIKIYTDGACSENPGAGGWGALLLIRRGDKKDKITIKGGEKYTTNNRMELTAVIEGLKFVYKNMLKNKDGSINDMAIRVISDSSYVVNTLTRGYINNWEKNGWKTAKGKDVLNQDLWRNATKVINKLNVEFKKVKGHNGNKFNEYVDQVAVKECSKYKQLLESLEM